MNIFLAIFLSYFIVGFILTFGIRLLNDDILVNDLPMIFLGGFITIPVILLLTIDDLYYSISKNNSVGEFCVAHWWRTWARPKLKYIGEIKLFSCIYKEEE